VRKVFFDIIENIFKVRKGAYAQLRFFKTTKGTKAIFIFKFFESPKKRKWIKVIFFDLLYP